MSGSARQDASRTGSERSASPRSQRPVTQSRATSARRAFLEPRYDAVLQRVPLGPRATEGEGAGESEREEEEELVRLITGAVLELKVAVVLGVAHTVLAFALGDELRRWELTRRVADDGGGGAGGGSGGGGVAAAAAAMRGTPFVCVPTTLQWVHGEGKLSATPTTADGCAEVASRLNEPAAIARVDEWVERIAMFFGANWLRVDILTGNEQLGWRVNEVTYPGHLPLSRAWEHLFGLYRARPALAPASPSAPALPWVLIPAADVLRQIADDLGVPFSFLAKPPSYSEPLFPSRHHPRRSHGSAAS